MLRLPEKGDEDNHPIGSGKVFFTDIFSGIKTRNTVCRKTQEGGEGGRGEGREGGRQEGREGREGGREGEKEGRRRGKENEGGRGRTGRREGRKKRRKKEIREEETYYIQECTATDLGWPLARKDVGTKISSGIIPMTSKLQQDQFAHCTY